MFKRVLQAANQVVVHEETHTGIRELSIEGTVNDKVDMLSVTGSRWQLVQEHGKNLITTPYVSNQGTVDGVTYTVNDDYSISAEGVTDIGTNFYFNRNVYLKAGTYTLSGMQDFVGMTLLMYDSNTKTTIARCSSGTVSTTFTTEVDYDSVIIYLNVELAGVEVNGNAYPMLQSGSTATEYEPFQPAMPSPEYPSDIMSVEGEMVSTNNCLGGKDKLRGNSITLPVLRSLPDGTADVLYVDRKAKRAWVERNVGVVTKTNSIWNDWGSVNNKNRVLISVINMKTPTDIEKCIGFCNIAKQSTVYQKECSNNIYTIKGYKIIYWYPDYTAMGLNGTESKAEADVALQAYLADTPFICEYALDTPIIEELEYSDFLLETAQYETNLMIDCDEHLEPEISATVKVLGR